MYQLYAVGFLSFPEDLSTEDKISLCIAEKYLDFKACCNLVITHLSEYVLKEGEAWYEVAGELAQEGTRPITPDQECLQEILQITEQKAEEVLKKQVKNNASLNNAILFDHNSTS